MESNMSRRSVLAAGVGAAVVAMTSEGQPASQPATAPANDPPEGAFWTDVRDLTLEGRAWNETEAFFDRLPVKAKGVVRNPVWLLSKNTAGMCVRFSSDSPAIYIDYTLLNQELAMNHMPATGMSGVDLYARSATGEWRWMDITRPSKKQVFATLAKTADPAMRDYLLYLPLYNGVQTMRLGISKGTTITPAPKRVTKPVVYYGTSIAQGGCASRPGMAHVAIAGRMIDREVINLGFSGNGQMEPEMAALVSEIDAGAFVIDCLPNCTLQQVEERTQPLIETIRARHPATPILMVTDPDWCHSPWSSSVRKTQTERRKKYRGIIQLLQEKDGNLHYLDLGNLFAPEYEGTVDGVHPNDLGMWRYAQRVAPAIQQILR